ncbi:MAG: bifunctional folylpolyglutamate synthase/dihydrofolate synthase [Acidimicrobiales bacterium]
MQTWSYNEMVEWLDSHASMEATGFSRASVPTLDRMRDVCNLMGNPENAQPVIHITGTNGKGSTAKLVAELLVARGLRVGTYSSPNLTRINERMAYCNEPISDEELCALMAELSAFENMLGYQLSRFELLTACAFRWFADRPADVVVLEVGLGGRWDATNVADADVAAITNISYDHVEILGPLLTDIAGEKAGIIKGGSVAVIGETDPDLVEIFEAAVTRVNASAGGASTGVTSTSGGAVLLAGRDFACTRSIPVPGGLAIDMETPWSRNVEVFLSMYGMHQGRNAVLALACVEAFFGSAYPGELLLEVFSRVSFDGRCEILARDPTVLLDGAHNVAGMHALAAVLKDHFARFSPKVLVTGMLTGRDPAAMLAALGTEVIDKVVVVPARSLRAVSLDALRDAAESVGFEVTLASSVVEGLQLAGAAAGTGGLVLVAGSLYVVGAAREAMVGGTLQPEATV